MPEPLPEAAAKRVEELLRQGVNAVEVSRQLSGQWPALTPARVRMVAYDLRIPIVSQAPGSRPAGSRQRAGSEANARRTRILELLRQGKTMAEIAALLGPEPAEPDDSR